jgi:type IV secretory pathway TraG/TraD family ATPase VirD4
MDPLLTVLYWLTKNDPLTASMLVEGGALVTGSPGSGKSSTAMMQIIMGFLRAGFGGIFFSAKPEDTRTYKALVKNAGREGPIVFGPGSGHSLDPLFYLWNRPGRGAAMLETIVDIFTLLMAIGNPDASASREPFWERKAQQLMRAAIVLLHLAGDTVSFFNIDRMISTFPKAPEDIDTQEWKDGFASHVIKTVNANRADFTAEQAHDFERAFFFACSEWPNLDHRVSSSVLAEWTGLADKFLYNPFMSHFSNGECTWIPEDITQANRIVICDFSPMEGGDTFRIASCLVKLICMDAFQKLDVTRHATPSFLVADEAQLLTLPKHRDERFQQVCRSARICSLYATQNLQQLAAEFGEHQLGPKTLGWLGNIGTRIAFQQSDNGSNEQLSDTIGKDYQLLKGSNVGPQQASFSSHPQLVHRVLPAEFITLKKASITDPEGEAIVFSGGRIFSNGQPHITTVFSREYKGAKHGTR